jgi:hypothetical protein
MTSLTICDDCPLRLFNTKHCNLQGIGNPYYGRLIIVPNVDYNAYKKGSMDFSSQVDIIKSILSSTGELEELYILPFIRCNETIGCEINDDIISRCQEYLKADFIKYNFTDIMLLGTAVNRFLHTNVNELDGKVVISRNNRRYYSNYSPLVKYTNEQLFNKFKTNLIKWYNKEYNNYEILQL